MTASPNLSEIAAKLTPAQHRAVLAGGPSQGRGYWSVLNALLDKRIMTSAARRYVLSPLGKDLQAHLQEAQG